MSNYKQSSVDEEFVPFEEALALKELGFDEPCFAVYFNTTQQLYFDKYINEFNKDVRTLAPTFSQAFRWFREKYNFLHLISWVYKKTEGIQWFFVIKGINMTNNNILPDSEIRFETYEEAELACLNKLIEIAKQGLLPLSK